MEKQNIFSGKKAGVLTVFMIGVVCAIVVVSSSLNSGVLDDDKSWHVIYEYTPLTPLGAEGSPTGGGILEIFFINSSSSAATDYATNTSSTLEDWCTAAGLGWENADDFSCELAHSVNFDVVVRVRGNASQCKRDTTWFSTDLKVEWTCADLGVGADTAMTGLVTMNNSDFTYLYMNFYDAGPFTLSKDETNTITSIKFSAYY